jgi:hypothetical protein
MDFEFRCRTCDEVHEGMPGFGAIAPLSYYAIPEAERASRCEQTLPRTKTRGDRQQLLQTPGSMQEMNAERGYRIKPQKWCARRDSNSHPSCSKANALSG